MDHFSFLQTLPTQQIASYFAIPRIPFIWPMLSSEGTREDKGPFMSAKRPSFALSSKYLNSNILYKDNDLLEKIQHRATKLIPQLAKLPYSQCIQNLDMYSLYCRRQRGNLIEIFKILRQFLQVDSSSFFYPVSYKFYKRA